MPTTRIHNIYCLLNKIFPLFSPFVIFFSNMAGKNWRAKKILTLVPPLDSEDSDLESDDDEERRIEAREFFLNAGSDSSPTSSPVRYVSSGVYDLLDDLSDCDDIDNERGTSRRNKDISDTSVSQTTQSLNTESSPLVAFSSNLPPCYIPETPSTSSVLSPFTPRVRTRRTKETANIESSPMPPPSILPACRKRKMKHLEFSFKKTKYTGAI